MRLKDSALGCVLYELATLNVLNERAVFNPKFQDNSVLTFDALEGVMDMYAHSFIKRYFYRKLKSSILNIFLLFNLRMLKINPKDRSSAYEIKTIYFRDPK